VTQITGRVETVPNALFQGFRVREAPVALAVPQDVALIGDLEHPARAGDERDLARSAPNVESSSWAIHD